jgi:hypothetical protein
MIRTIHAAVPGCIPPSPNPIVTPSNCVSHPAMKKGLVYVYTKQQTGIYNIGLYSSNRKLK